MIVEDIIAPGTEPLLLEEIRQHLRLSHQEDDTGIATMMSSARAHLEEYLGLALINRTVRISAASWREFDISGPRTELPFENLHCVPVGVTAYKLSLPVRPLFSIQTIDIVEPDGTQATWDAENYHLKPGLTPELTLSKGSHWPRVDSSHTAIQINAVAGFGASWNDIPPDLHQALLRLVTHFAYARGDSDSGAMSPIAAAGCQGLVAPYQNRRIG